MAFFYLRTSIIRAKNGKSAVASSAYMSANSLYSQKLGRTFQYCNKEEVIFSEVLLPENAPDEYKNPEVLWNAVEKKENKINSRYARQFIIALPKEWNREECIEFTREFIQKALVDKGMAVQWAFHNKDGNPHVHIQCTVRGFKKDGTWEQMEKKEYLLVNGEKVPEIDPLTGEQKIRIRNRNGRISTEKLYKRVTVQSNEWNSRKFLKEVKKQWAETCNKYLPEEEKIEHRSYEERGMNRVPLIHAAKWSEEDKRENEERREINRRLQGIEEFIATAKIMLEDLKLKIVGWKQRYEEERRRRTTRIARRNERDSSGISGYNQSDNDRIRTGKLIQRIKDDTEMLEEKTEKMRKKHRRRR